MELGSGEEYFRGRKVPLWGIESAGERPWSWSQRRVRLKHSEIREGSMWWGQRGEQSPPYKALYVMIKNSGFIQWEAIDRIVSEDWHCIICVYISLWLWCRECVQLCRGRVSSGFSLLSCASLPCCFVPPFVEEPLSSLNHLKAGKLPLAF